MTPARRTLLAAPRTLLLVGAALIWLFPYLWMLLTSLKSLDDVVAQPGALWPALWLQAWPVRSFAIFSSK